MEAFSRPKVLKVEITLFSTTLNTLTTKEIAVQHASPIIAGKLRMWLDTILGFVHNCKVSPDRSIYFNGKRSTEGLVFVIRNIGVVSK